MWANIALFLVILFFFLILQHFLPRMLSLRHGRLPKGSFGWPVLGENLSFLKPHPSTSTGSFLQNHCSRYGKVFKSHLFFSPTVVSCDPDLNYYILQNEGRYFECSYPKALHGVLGEKSMLVAVGETHKRIRNAVVSLVATTKSRPDFLNDIERSVIRSLDSWKDKGEIAFSKEARKYTFNVIVKQVLGLSPDEQYTAQILQDFLTFMRGLVSLPIYIHGTPYARAVQARHRISSTIKAIMNGRRRNARNGYEKSDFLDILLSLDSLSEDEKISVVLDTLLAGYETTSLLLSMVVFFLGQSPNALQHLKAEHQKIKESQESLNWNHYKDMKFTQNVINEALRFGNVVKFLHRKAIRDVKFKDYIIPSGWKVLPIISAVHLDPSHHVNPLEFNPWRWQKQDQACKTLTPFGGGSRLCPGYELAKVEVAFFLHHLVQKYRWKVDENDIPIAFPYVEFPRGLKLNVECI